MRRVIGGLFLLFLIAVNVPPLMAPKRYAVEPAAMTSLHALYAAQLLHSTSVGEGRYATTLEQLNVTLPPEYRFELISTGDSYTATATPRPNQPRGLQGHRSFCVTMSGSIHWSPGATIPAIQAGRCPEGWKTIQ